jgi:membrane fusion protein, multidrug efflux system
VGQLIASGGGTELFHLAQTNPLRVYVKVPQRLSRQIKTGQKGVLTLDEMPGREFEAKVVRTAGAMDAESRTLLVELQVDNSKGEILAGAFAQARFEFDSNTAQTLKVPQSTLLFRAEGVQVGVVDKNGQVSLRTLKLGRDFGQSLEVLDGIRTTDQMIVNPPDLLANGTQVRVVKDAQNGQKP